MHCEGEWKERINEMRGRKKNRTEREGDLQDRQKGKESLFKRNITDYMSLRGDITIIIDFEICRDLENYILYYICIQ